MACLDLRVVLRDTFATSQPFDYWTRHVHKGSRLSRFYIIRSRGVNFNKLSYKYTYITLTRAQGLHIIQLK